MQKEDECRFAIGVAPLPKLVNLKARNRLIPFPIVPEDLPFSEQPTLIMPAIVVQDTLKSIQAVAHVSGAQGYIALVRNLVKSSGIYAIASLALPLLSLILAPFLTHSLSRSDYGALVVLNTAITLVTGITQLGLVSSVFRAYNYDYESRRDRLGVLSTTIVLLFATSFPVAFVVILTAPWLASLLLGSSSYTVAIQVTALVVLMQNLTVPGFAWLRAESRPVFFSILSIINVVITLGANVALVGIIHMGIVGSLLATGIGYALVLLCTLPLMLLRAGFASRFDIARNLLSFGIPLVFNSMAYWVLQLSDRYLLTRLGSLSETATYSVAYTLGGVLNAVIIAPFMLAWGTAAFTIAKRKDAPQAFQLVFRWFSLILLLASFAFTLIAMIALDLLFPPTYHSAAPIIPIINLSIMFYGIYYIFSVGAGVQRKNWFVALVMMLSALVNVGCNIVLIPLYGSMGAALSTLIAYIFLALLMYIVNQRIYPIPFEIHLFIIALLVGIAMYLGCIFWAQHQTIYGIYGTYAIYISSTVIYGGCLVLLKMIATWSNKNRRRRVKKNFVA